MFWCVRYNVTQVNLEYARYHVITITITVLAFVCVVACQDIGLLHHMHVISMHIAHLHSCTVLKKFKLILM